MAAVRHKLDSRHRSVRNTHLLKRSTLYSISCCAIPKICNPAGLLHQIATAHTRQSFRTENFSILFSRIETRVDPMEYIHTCKLQVWQPNERTNPNKEDERQQGREEKKLLSPKWELLRSYERIERRSDPKGIHTYLQTADLTRKEQ
jgi:hypothetical protein